MGFAAAALLYVVLGAVVWTRFSRARPDAGVEAFVAGFDRFFAVRRVRGLALPSFCRSVLVSCASLLVLAALWVLGKEDFSRLMRFGSDTSLWSAQTQWLLVVYGGATVLTNWIPDYLSLVQSRWMIERIARQRGPVGWLVWLVADAALTLAIAFAAIYLGTKLVLPLLGATPRIEVGCLTAASFTLADAWEIFCAGLMFESPPATINYDAAGIYVYSTFLTSVWLWLYLAASFAAKIAAVAFPRAPRRSTTALLGWFAVIVFSGAFWSARFLEPPKADVRIIAAPDSTRIAAHYRAALEASDLTVTDEGPASLVLLVETERGDPRETKLDAEIRCGARARRSVRRLYPNEPPARVVAWARRASTLLGYGELKVCLAADGAPPPPPCPHP